MTAMFIKHKTFMFPLSLLLLLFFASTDTNAMLIKDMYAFCKETEDVNFCLKYIGTDVRIITARDFNDVLLIAISQCQYQVNDAATQIDKVRQKFSGPIGTHRIVYCQNYYELAYALFRKAYEEAEGGEFASVAQISATDGLNYMRKCEDEWKKNGPIQKSPVTFYLTNVVKLLSIIQVIIEKING
ncbi:hypothetical protein CARUB_v10006738mg [Capsella rubella]|uniref:Pectinesterase inhibitor domain-containing protein n=1 Tax=Capsella rubella TaxID=81985 RepID=R0F993_9BRAS|nr:pectinesterase inhibitor 5 [Capsella rubella]EOA18246.1 hypothetical protein CARUB_v10006738mg [Capsella rubella]